MAVATIITILLIHFPFDKVKEPVLKKTSKIINEQKVEPKRLFLDAWRTAKNQYVDPKMNTQDWSRWKKRYENEIETEDDAYVAINSMLQSLDDPYTRFMNMSEANDQNVAIDSNISGIGASIMQIAGKFVIYNVISGSPAKKYDLQIGDIIEKINDTEISNLSIDNVVSKIRGKKGSYVKLSIKRNNKILTKIICRDIVTLKNVQYKKIKDIGYIQVGSFIGKTTPQEFEEAIMQTQNTKGIIIDLRGDSGGLFDNAILMSDMIITQGEILNVVYRNGFRNPILAHDTAIFRDKPIVVLINRGTASSAEIFAGTLRDNKKAILVGTRSYGKNSVQEIIPMPNHTGMNITIAKYYIPSGEDIHNVGIKPDYEIYYTQQDYLNNRDTQLIKAIEILNNITGGK
ncbi:MAG: S41 family peptidase [Candidatus Gastranaerophilales bacterium]|nr:S41 family peptidase [Candidatus Gastranaerophilales bacterium]